MDLVVIYTFVSYIYILSAGQHHDSRHLGFICKCHKRSGLSLLGLSGNATEDQDWAFWVHLEMSLKIGMQICNIICLQIFEQIMLHLCTFLLLASNSGFLKIFKEMTCFMKEPSTSRVVQNRLFDRFVEFFSNGDDDWRSKLVIWFFENRQPGDQNWFFEISGNRCGSRGSYTRFLPAQLPNSANGQQPCTGKSCCPFSSVCHRVHYKP